MGVGVMQKTVYVDSEGREWADEKLAWRAELEAMLEERLHCRDAAMAVNELINNQPLREAFLEAISHVL